MIGIVLGIFVKWMCSGGRHSILHSAALNQRQDIPRIIRRPNNSFPNFVHRGTVICRSWFTFMSVFRHLPIRSSMDLPLLNFFQAIDTLFTVIARQCHLINRYLLLRTAPPLHFLAYLLIRNRKTLKNLIFKKRFYSKICKAIFEIGIKIKYPNNLTRTS